MKGLEELKKFNEDWEKKEIARSDKVVKDFLEKAEKLFKAI